MSNMTDPNGFRIIASAGSQPNPADLPTPTNDVVLESFDWIAKKYSCRHIGPWSFKVSVYGGIITTTRENPLCPECLIEELKRDVIRCALCTLPIFPNDPVVVYTPSSDQIHKDIAKFLDEKTVLGCLRWDCCPSGGFFAGHWTGKGFQQYDFGGNTEERKVR